jgi:hypothetical protein
MITDTPPIRRKYLAWVLRNFPEQDRLEGRELDPAYVWV